MDTINTILIGLGVLIVLGGAILTVIEIRKVKLTLPPAPIIPTPHVTVDLHPLEQAIDKMPTKVLQSIQGSVNTHKGVLGELVGYTKLHAEYNRIIPLGNIVDFIGIKFPSDTEPGCVDFIDVKTGNAKRLSKDQRALQKLITDKQIHFVKLKVDISAG